MASEAVQKYISVRYERWLDYSRYHCEKAGIQDEFVDVLNEVLYMLLQKDSGYLDGLYNSKKGQYREIDYYILQMIKFNIQSPTSPYQWKYKHVPIDENTEFSRLDIIDEPDESIDAAEDTLIKMNKVREVFEQLALTDFEKAVFTHCFFCHEKVSEWTGKESKSIVYNTYRNIRNAIHSILNGLNKAHKIELRKIRFDKKKKRENEIVEQFFNKHIISQTINEIYLSDKAIEIFSFKFFRGLDFSEWTGCESRHHLGRIYNNVIDLLQQKIDGNMLF